MNIILLSGGSGVRLWPLSNEFRAKQFLKIFKTANGVYESMIQRMYRSILSIDKNAKIVIATSNSQVGQIRDNLGDDVDISVEPMRRDTFPAISLASAYLFKKGIKKSESIIVCPVDSLVDELYFETFKLLENNSDNVNLNLIGIKPTYPSEKYGYIIPESHIVDSIYSVKNFKEKPDKSEAEELINKGAFWNSGVFCFKLGYILGIIKKNYGFNDYDTIYSKYKELKKISFDYAVVEKEENINVIEYAGKWEDLGTWSSLVNVMADKITGNVSMDKCSNTNIINELSLPIIALGLDNTVIVATPDGILISDKNESEKLKNYVPKNRPMFEKRIWGEYKVLNYSIHNNGENALTKELIINSGKNISYQMHEHRTEFWTIVEGKGKLVIDDKIINISRGDSITIKPNTKHAIKAIEELHIIEVQLGDELTEEDIKRFDYKW